MNNDATKSLSILKDIADSLGFGVFTVANFLLDDPRFLVWSGSSKEYQHHYGQGGLVRHICEVVQLSLDTSHYFPEHKIDPRELFLAALFHDCGKLYDYEPSLSENTPTSPYIYWQGTEHKRLIHHISRSGLMWSEASKLSDTVNSRYHDKVLHAILAHHGQREWGSPVAPKTRVAWLVHHCDCISARMCDADSWDVTKE